jgi:hypothetical protein
MRDMVIFLEVSEVRMMLKGGNVLYASLVYWLSMVSVQALFFVLLLILYCFQTFCSYFTLEIRTIIPQYPVFQLFTLFTENMPPLDWVPWAYSRKMEYESYSSAVETTRPLFASTRVV